MSLRTRKLRQKTKERASLCLASFYPKHDLIITFVQNNVEEVQ